MLRGRRSPSQWLSMHQRRLTRANVRANGSQLRVVLSRWCIMPNISPPRRKSVAHPSIGVALTVLGSSRGQSTIVIDGSACAGVIVASVVSRSYSASRSALMLVDPSVMHGAPRPRYPKFRLRRVGAIRAPQMCFRTLRGVNEARARVFSKLWRRLKPHILCGAWQRSP